MGITLKKIYLPEPKTIADDVLIVEFECKKRHQEKIFGEKGAPKWVYEKCELEKDRYYSSAKVFGMSKFRPIYGMGAYRTRNEVLSLVDNAEPGDSGIVGIMVSGKRGDDG